MISFLLFRMASNTIPEVDENEEVLRDEFNTEEWKTKLKCPVCFNYPYGSIFGCRNGHHYCNDCRAKLTKCPLCRDKAINCRQLMVEVVLRTALKNTFSVCQHEGCRTRCPFDQWMDHQQRCPFRPIRCPKSSLNMCQFRGNLTDFIAHCARGNCCELNIHKDLDKEESSVRYENDSTFTGVVNYRHVDPPLFRRILPTTSFTYKPAIFLSTKMATVGLATLIIIRTPAKYWRLVPMILVPNDHAKYWNVHLTVTDLSRPDAHKYSYWGPPIGNDLPQSYIHNTRCCLTMHEQQFREMDVASAQCRFEYTITFTIKDAFLERCRPWIVNMSELKLLVQKSLETRRNIYLSVSADEDSDDDDSMPELEGPPDIDEVDTRTVGFFV